MAKRTCSVEGCDRPHKCRGFCSRHGMAARRAGELKPIKRPTPIEGFWSRVEKTETCWNWTGQRSNGRYGRWRGQMAYRYCYELLVGPIPDGMFLDHMCHNPACVNPEHLRPVTQKQNSENLSGARRDSKSGVRGVYWSRGKWRVTVCHDQRVINGGGYATIEDAEQAAIALRNRLFTHNIQDHAASA